MFAVIVTAPPSGSQSLGGPPTWPAMTLKLAVIPTFVNMSSGPATGGRSSSTTSTSLVMVAVFPSGSVTTSRARKMPSAEYSCAAVAPVPLPPSPKLHSYVSAPASGSVDWDALNATLSGGRPRAGVIVKVAVGAAFGSAGHELARNDVIRTDQSPGVVDRCSWPAIQIRQSSEGSRAAAVSGPKLEPSVETAASEIDARLRLLSVPRESNVS